MNLSSESFPLKVPDRDVMLSSAASFSGPMPEAEDCETPFERWLHLADELLNKHRA
jgi:hypothetical protein